MSKKLYDCRFEGRKLGAIGIFYNIRETVWAEDEEDAREQLNEKFELLHSLTIEDMDADPPTVSCMACDGMGVLARGAFGEEPECKACHGAGEVVEEDY